METKLKIIQPNGEETEVTLDMAPRPALDDIQAALAPYFGRAYTERVNVLVGKNYTDMFVDENGLLTNQPRNEKATEIYRNNWLTQHPETDPERLGFIVGTAVVFSRRVWF